MNRLGFALMAVWGCSCMAMLALIAISLILLPFYAIWRIAHGDYQYFGAIIPSGLVACSLLFRDPTKSRF